MHVVSMFRAWFRVAVRRGPRPGIRGKAQRRVHTGEAPRHPVPGATREHIGQYSTEEQRSQAGCIAARMQRGLRHGLPALAVAALLASLGGCGGAGGGDADRAEPPTLLVSAAASLSEVIGAVADRFEEERGVRILLNVAGSQTLAVQIIEGAPVDVFISADVLQMERVVEAGRIHAARRVDLLSNRLVIVVPSDRAGTVTRPEDLLEPAIERIALGDPEAVPAGVYARNYLETQGLWGPLRARVVPANSVRAALRAVEAGTVDAGIVYRTDVRTAAGVVIAFPVPPEDGPSIVYPAAVVADAPSPAEAARFLDYLRSDTARRRFDRAGFVSLPDVGEPAVEAAP